MDIASLSMGLAQSSTMNTVGTAMLSKAMDANEQMGGQIAQMIDRSAMELSVNPNVGANFDVSC